jgi:hypothetical protein
MAEKTGLGAPAADIKQENEIKGKIRTKKNKSGCFSRIGLFLLCISGVLVMVAGLYNVSLPVIVTGSLLFSAPYWWDSLMGNKRVSRIGTSAGPEAELS